MLNTVSSTQQSTDVLGLRCNWRLSPDSELGSGVLASFTAWHALNVLSGFSVVSGGSLNLVPVIPSWPAVGHLICIFSHEEDRSNFKRWKVFHSPVVLTLGLSVKGVRSLQLGGPGTPHLRPWSGGLREHVWAGALCFSEYRRQPQQLVQGLCAQLSVGASSEVQNPRALGLASKGTRSRCCHGEKGESGSGKGLV